MNELAVSQQTDLSASRPGRLYYLDWLRLLATLGVYLFHVISVFSGVNFEIVNKESSDTLFVITTFFYPWGMPLFFLVAGAASWFALRRRSPAQFRRERVYRLLVPFLTGTILLGSLQMFLAWRHRSETGVFSGSFLDFVADRVPHVGPKFFGAFGYHMWFLGFLFAFSLLALPLFIWLKGEKGRQLVSRLARFCTRRGGILIFVMPIVLTRLVLHPFFPQLQDWADFFTYGMFFVLGFLVYADERFSRAIWRDWWIMLAVGISATLATSAIFMSLESIDIERAPGTFSEFMAWFFIAICGWCWVAFMLFVGMRYLDYDGKALRYGQETLLPFFVLHQPMILAVAYFVVQWEAAIPVKLLAVGLGAFVLTLGLCELVIKRVGFLRTVFGMKSRTPVRVEVAVT